MTLIAGELAANAVRHGHVPGRDFRLTLTVTPTTLRVEVTDTRGELKPKPRSTRAMQNTAAACSSSRSSRTAGP
jgi:anti-sigma regulatory factor (Ser/Thr protein kinase)